MYFVYTTLQSACTINSLLVDLKLTVLSFFLHGSYFLKYADSSNYRDFFLHGSLVLLMSPIKYRLNSLISRIRVTAKKPSQLDKTSFFFFQFSSLPARLFLVSKIESLCMCYVDNYLLFHSIVCFLNKQMLNASSE